MLDEVTYGQDCTPSPRSNARSRSRSRSGQVRLAQLCEPRHPAWDFEALELLALGSSRPWSFTMQIANRMVLHAY